MAEKKNLQQIADVVREGRKIVLPAEPKPMPARVAAKILSELASQEEMEVDLTATFPTPPYAGAIALSDTLERLFGYAISRNTIKQGFFGPVEIKPDLISVQVAHDRSREVLWGTFVVPGTTILLECGFDRVGKNFICFRLSGKCLQADKAIAGQLFDEIRKEITERSIYRGKAIQIEQDHDTLDLKRPDSIRFMRVDADLRQDLILNKSTHDAVETELMTPVEHYDFAKSAWGVNMNRVVLLSGTYGTGKSMTAAALAGVCENNDSTFILLKNVTALPSALEFIRVTKLPRAVVFAEDIDQVMVGDRDSDKNTLLNLISGVESTTSEVMVVLTTNNIELVHPAMIRRFQAVVEYQLPDAEAAERLCRLYGAGRVSGDLPASSKLLTGVLPSLIKDTVETAKLSAIRHGRLSITDDDLVWAAAQLDTRKRLSARKVEQPPLETALAQLGTALSNGHSGVMMDYLNDIDDSVSRVRSHLGV